MEKYILPQEKRYYENYQNKDLLTEYKYNKDGIRTSKRANGEQIMYYLENNNIIYEQRANNMIYYIRDGIGDLIGLEYNGSVYYYLKNAQNDIISILDSNYTSIANYTYDAYGNILSITDNLGNDISNNTTHIANINPFRYRSYYYDKETNLYYLNSRYYNPEIGRFINADIILGEIGGKAISYNTYHYAANNPINFTDSEGNWPKILKNITIGNIAMGISLVAAGMLGGAPLVIATAVIVLTSTFVSGVKSGTAAAKSGSNQAEVKKATNEGLASGYASSAVSTAISNVGGLVKQTITNALNSKYDLPTSNQTNGIIKGYTSHGETSVFNHDKGAGINSNSIIDTVTNNQAIYNSRYKTFEYHGETSRVSLNYGGEVVTAWPKNKSAYRFK